MFSKYKDGVLRLIDLQKKLTEKFHNNYPQVTDFKLFLDFPKEGTININDECWSFLKHGLGVKFTRKRPAPSLVVDIISDFNNPLKIDAWRFMLFLESIGESFNERECASILDELVSSNFLEKKSGRYQYECIAEESQFTDG